MPGFTIQEQNQDMVSLLSAYFRLLYNPAHALADAVGMLHMFPGLVGLWPGSTVNSNGQLIDISGNGLNLQNNNSVLFGRDNLAPHTAFNGSNQYFSRASEAVLNITGTEAYVGSSIQGLTLGGWFYFSNAASAVEAMIYKLNATNQNYFLQRRTDGTARFGVYNTTEFNVTSTAIIGEDSWYFVAGRFDPSVELKVWVNGQTVSNTTSIPASVDAEAAPFTLAATGVPGNYMAGRITQVFLCAAAVPDVFINTYYQMTAPLFGISI